MYIPIIVPKKVENKEIKTYKVQKCEHDYIKNDITHAEMLIIVIVIFALMCFIATLHLYEKN